MGGRRRSLESNVTGSSKAWTIRGIQSDSTIDAGLQKMCDAVGAKASLRLAQRIATPLRRGSRDSLDFGVNPSKQSHFSSFLTSRTGDECAI